MLSYLIPVRLLHVLVSVVPVMVNCMLLCFCFTFYPLFVVLRSFVLSNNIYVHSNTFSVVVVEEFDWSIRSIVTVAVSPI